jgi:hypothetical protein
MSEDKQDKLKIKLKEYDREREFKKSEAFKNFAQGQELTEEEIELIREEIPSEEDLKNLDKSSKIIADTLREIVEPTIQATDTISKTIDKIMQPSLKNLQHISKGLQKSLKPVFDDIDKQYKESPLTRKDIEESSKRLEFFAKQKEEIVKTIKDLEEKQDTLYSKIFEETQSSEQDILKYKLEIEEIDLPCYIFEDISKKLRGKETTRTTINDFIEKEMKRKLSKTLQNKWQQIKQRAKEGNLENLEDINYTKQDEKKLTKFFEELSQEAIFFDDRPSKLELEHINIERKLQGELPVKFLLYESTDIQFENISEENFKTYLQEEIEILKEAIQLKKTLDLRFNEIVNLFSKASNPYFEGKKEDELTEEERSLKEEFYNATFLVFQNENNFNQLFYNIFLKSTSFKEQEIEVQERFASLLKNDLEDLEDLFKEWNPQEEEIVEQYLTTNSKDRKILTTEKIVPQLMLSGQKIESKFQELEKGKIEKVTFDLSSDNDKKFFIQVFMKEYRIPFTDDTFKTLESLMTIQNLMEKKFGTLKGINFSTKDIIFLNKGGRVTNYSKDLIQKTNRELISLMSAIGSLDTTDYFFKYYNIDDDTIVEENEAIFKQIETSEEWEKKLDELRKEKIKTLPEDKKIPLEKIKKISTLQPFVNLKGIEIESDEEAYNNTFWKFNDIDEKPIPIFEFLKITGRFASLPLEMDSYLTDSTINNEVTRNLKTIIANLNYYKSNTQMKKDKTKRNFLEYYFEGTKEGETESRTFEPFEAMQLLKEKKIVGQWRYKATRTIDSIAKDCKFDEERGIGLPKQWQNKMERPRFCDSIIDYLRKAKEDKNIVDFILYTTKDKIVKDEDYITENEKRRQKTKDKIKGKTTKTKQKRNPTIEKISIIIK